MSSSSDPESLFEMSEGIGLAEAIRRAWITWTLAILFSILSGLQTIFEFLFLPFEIFISIASASVNSFILQPFGLVNVGAGVTAQEIDFFGIAALPVSVILALGTLLLVLLFLQLEISSNILPGLFVDNRVVDFLFTSPEEEAEGED